MERGCFLCGGPTETLRSATWSLPHLKAQPIGFGYCTSCGLALQTSSVTPDEMTRYYTESAVYTNPGRGGQPAPGKVRGVERAIEMVCAGLGRMPASAWQVGCSDGYTLFRWREAGCASVGGVEPSAASCELARERYGIETTLGTVESVELPEGVETWILTHVLEHLYDPLEVMRRIRASQARGGSVLVEVPLLERPDRFPPSYLTFEHLNFFGEASLVSLLTRAGYEVDSVEKSFSEDLYPIIRVLAHAAVRPLGDARPRAGEAWATRTCLEQYIARERCLWAHAESRVRAALPAGAPTWLWGAGIHSSQLLAQTHIEQHLDLRGLVDSSPIRHGQSFGRYRIHDPATIEFGREGAIVISSHAAENEIWRALAAERAAGVPVVRLYAEPERADARTPLRQGAA